MAVVKKDNKLIALLSVWGILLVPLVVCKVVEKVALFDDRMLIRLRTRD